MECVDFCLFGVYGVDGAESILVEQPDNCRKGCPACSRVCPENAIIFPQHKAPAIAGASVDGDEGFKIDLSELFGAPKTDEDPIATAARERDEQLLLAGRDAVGIDDQLKKRQERSCQRSQGSTRPSHRFARRIGFVRGLLYTSTMDFQVRRFITSPGSLSAATDLEVHRTGPEFVDSDGLGSPSYGAGVCR